MFYLHHIFRSFLPFQNPIGFGGVDFLEVFIAAALVSLALLWPRVAGVSARFASRSTLCMLALFVAPIALRLLLLRTHQIPTPAVADDFSYVLLGDTLAHFRLANPVHPMHRFFETFFVLQEPSYSSIYPLGQGIALAVGQWIFGNPWAGVAISIGIFCALCYWMLRGWTTPAWALLGGALAVIEFGPLNQWMNSFWGGAVSAIAGCLVFGSLGRLRSRGSPRYGVLLGVGLGIQLLARPFEFLLLIAALCLFVLFYRPRAIPFALIALLPAVALMLWHNKRVTGSCLTLPYQVSRAQYGVPASFTFQPNPVPTRELTREQRLDYEIQSSVHGPDRDGFASYWRRFLTRIRFYRFFFLAPLYIALAAYLCVARRLIWIPLSLLLFSVGTTFYPYFYSHYIAVLACLFIFISMLGLQKLGPTAAQWVVFLCFTQFALWYTVHLIGDSSLWQFETWDAINYGDPDGRLAIRRQLESLPGKQLVFVRYGPRHTFKEWVYNSANIDPSKVIWARDLGMEDNELLLRHYPDRRAWLLEPDTFPVELKRYQSRPAPSEAPTAKKPRLKFEEVH